MGRTSEPGGGEGRRLGPRHVAEIVGTRHVEEGAVGGPDNGRLTERDHFEE